MSLDHTAYLSIGSNLGDKFGHCRNAMSTIEKNGVGKIVAQSLFYATEPVDYKDQDWFLNAALKLITPLDPRALLEKLQQIQSAGGRKNNGIRFGPRVIDLDIIFYDNSVFEDVRLVIPHPRMHKRRFVLQPICDIDPQVVHPVLGKTVDELLGNLDKDDQRICRYPCAF